MHQDRSLNTAQLRDWLDWALEEVQEAQDADAFEGRDAVQLELLDLLHAAIGACVAGGVGPSAIRRWRAKQAARGRSEFHSSARVIERVLNINPAYINHVARARFMARLHLELMRREARLDVS